MPHERDRLQASFLLTTHASRIYGGVKGQTALALRHIFIATEWSPLVHGHSSNVILENAYFLSYRQKNVNRPGKWRNRRVDNRSFLYL